MCCHHLSPIGTEICRGYIGLQSVHREGAVAPPSPMLICSGRIQDFWKRGGDGTMDAILLHTVGGGDSWILSSTT